MARKTNYNLEKRQRELQKQENKAPRPRPSVRLLKPERMTAPKHQLIPAAGIKTTGNSPFE